MPLVIDGSPCVVTKKTIDSIFNSESFKESSKNLRDQKVKEVPSKDLLYVNQREFAVVSPSDEFIKIIGTQDATTCHVVVIRHTGSGVTALAHCDGCDTEAALSEMVDSITSSSEDSPSGRLDVHIVGGFLDDRQESIKLSKTIIGVLTSCSSDLHLQTACITNLNDTIINGTHFPVIYGLAVNVESGEIFPASFPDQGPELDVRSASHFVGFSKMLNIYENGTGVLKIGPFTWEPWVDVDRWCSLPDSFIRKYLSTSPAQEPEHFERNVRAALRVIMQHPHPDITLFPGGRPHRFRLQRDGQWKRLEEVSGN